MKKIRILMSSALIALAGMFSSCTQEEFKPGEQVDGAQVYFPAEAQTSYSIDDQTTSVSIPVRRLVKDGELEVDILVNTEALDEMSATELFTFPSSVSFNDGQDESMFTVTFTRSELKDGEEYSFGLLLNDEDNTSPYGNRTLYVSVAPWPWEYIGEGKYREDYLTVAWEIDNVEVPCRIHRHKSQEGLYMVEEMFGWDLLFTAFEAEDKSEFDGFLTYTPTNIVVNCADPAAVVIPKQFTGITEVNSGYGAFEIATYTSGAGTLVDGVITFPKEGLAAVVENVGTVPANPNGMFRILLPGAEAVDYSLAATYSGMRVGADNVTASAVIDFSYGEDVTGISYVFASGDVSGDVSGDATALIEGIVDGTAENIYTVDGFVEGAGKVSVEAALEVGSYTVVAVPSDKTGQPNAGNAAVAWFYFPGVGGGNTPDCDFEISLHKVSEYADAADLVSNYPDYSSFVYELTGSGIRSVKWYVNKTEVVESIPDMGMTAEDVINSYGKEFTPEQLAELKTTGKCWDIIAKLSGETSYTMLVLVQNEYGKSEIKSAEITTEPLPYDGELVIGDYLMACSVTDEGEEEPSVFQTVLKVSPTPGSTEKFMVKNLLNGDGISWFATYNPELKTLTLDGKSDSFGDEAKEENLFAEWLPLTSDMAVVYYSYSDPEGDANIPLVFTVDESKKLSGLSTNLEIGVGELKGNSVSPLGLAAAYYAGETTIVAGSDVQKASRMNVAPSFGISPSFKMSSSFRLPADGPILSGMLASKGNAASLNGLIRDSKVVTLEVKTSVCEPLPSEGRFKVKRLEIR